MKSERFFIQRLLLLAFTTVWVASANAIKVANDDGVTINYQIQGDNAIVISGERYVGDISIPASITYNDVTYSVTSIGDQAFYSCRNLTSVQLPSSITSIGDEAFYSCEKLTSINLPEGLETIGVDAFCNCEKLESIYIPKTVSVIRGMMIVNGIKFGYNNPFTGNDGMTSIIVDPDNTTFDSRDNCNAIIRTATNTLVAGCQNTTIPNSVTRIENKAFYQCGSLKSIEIPSSVTSIGDDVFETCWALSSINIPGSVTTIGENAFYFCTNLSSVILSEGLESIGADAFYYCKKLESIYIPKTVSSIGMGVTGPFSGNDGMTSIIVDPGNTTFDSRDNCNAIIRTATNTLVAGCHTTTIPNSVARIGNSAFYQCGTLQSVEIPSSVTRIGDCAFEGCHILSSIQIPESVTTIGNQAFANCESLTSVTLTEGLETIGDAAFDGCQKLESIFIPSTVSSINPGTSLTGAFSGNNGMLSMVVSPDNPTYDSRDNCNAIIRTATNTLVAGCQATQIPTSVKRIGKTAFYFCSTLKSIEIPSSVTSIDEYAFAYCSGLTEVKSYIQEPFQINENVFESIGNDAILYVPQGTKDAYQQSVGWEGFKDIIELNNDLINSIEAGANQINGELYNLQGARMKQKPVRRGIYLHQGKKVMVK